MTQNEENRKVQDVVNRLDNPDRIPGWNQCQYCYGVNLEVINYDSMWRDGDVTCSDCGKRVRSYDAG